jgi:hypothetical protein
MGKAPLRALLQHLRRIVAPQDGGLTDGHLLERFVNERDESAFEVQEWLRTTEQEQDAERLALYSLLEDCQKDLKYAELNPGRRILLECPLRQERRQVWKRK